MENLVKASSIFRRNYFSSYSEFYLALAIGKVLKDRGYVLDMDSMEIDPDLIPEDILKYYKKLLNDGALHLSMFERTEDADEIEPVCAVETSWFREVELFEDNGVRLDWNYASASERYDEYGKKYFFNLKIMGSGVLHLVASHLIDVLDGKTSKRLVIHFDEYRSKNTHLFVNIYSCLKTMPWLDEYIGLDVDFGDSNIDLDYSIFCNNGVVAGHYKPHTVGEKLGYMKKLGMVKGAILGVWTRKGMCPNNEFGYITESSIIRLDEIGDTFLGVTRIAVNKTKEETRRDYFDISEEIRYLFVDMLENKPHVSSTELDLTSIGIDNYFYNEDQFITLLDVNETVQKLVTIDGKEAEVEMKEVDSIYWLLRQYDIDFDKKLFKNMYFNGEEPLYDVYNATNGD